MSNSKSTDLYCANCLHCKEFTYTSSLTGARERRVRCAAGKWATAAGKEKSYSLHTVLARRKPHCDRYESMGESDLGDYIATLRETLPAERIVEHPPATNRMSA
ncbi:MAG TPA: hypothetical protein PKW95_24055 [bacterium]|nr:hypothetical protein [bacterium]